MDRLLEDKAALQTAQDVRQALVSIADQALQAEQEHLLRTMKTLFEGLGAPGFLGKGEPGSIG